MCNLCDKQFSQKRYLANHVRFKHPNPQHFVEKQLVRDLVMVEVPDGTVSKKYSCKLCGKECSHKKNLATHIRKNHKPEVQDDQAPDGKSSDHVPEDSNIRNFECNICKKTFTYQKSLRHHTKVCHKVEDEASKDSTHEVDFPSGLHYCCSSCQEIFEEEELEAHKKETGHEEATKFRYPANFPGWK